MTALIDSIRAHYEIPATFDGELPARLIGSSSVPPMQMGDQYLIPDGNGEETAGRLYSATVDPISKLVYGIYELDNGRRVIVTNPLTDEEVDDYRRYPDTFFGAVVKTVKRAGTFIEKKCDFLFETYQRNSRERLLEFMADASDIEHLNTLDQRGLAIVYCERMARSMQVDEDQRRAEAGSA